MGMAMNFAYNIISTPRWRGRCPENTCNPIHQGLNADVGPCAEGDGQVYLPEHDNLLVGDDPVKQRPMGSEA